jgi:hypothetical protein
MIAPRPSFLLLAATLGGCVHLRPLLPREEARGVATAASIEEVPTCGHQVTVSLVNQQVVEGELIAADATALHVLDADRLASIAAAEIDRVTVRVLPNRSGGIAGVTVLGTISTVSNGYFLLFTAPLWIISGTAAGTNAITRSFEVAPPADPALPAYARFPQGLPPGWPPTSARPPTCLQVPVG